MFGLELDPRFLVASTRVPLITIAYWCSVMSGNRRFIHLLLIEVRPLVLVVTSLPSDQVVICSVLDSVVGFFA